METEPVPPRFEDVLLHYEFSGLVNFAMDVARWIKKSCAARSTNLAVARMIGSDGMSEKPFASMEAEEAVDRLIQPRT